jgi:hypothetical protein
VGNDGDWNDPQHWSAISGGAGGASVPTDGDDVFFDNSSFSVAGAIVNVTADAQCRNMNWTNAGNNPVFTGPDSITINIGGSLEFSPNMTHDFAGDYHFTGSSPSHTITSNGNAFNNHIIFNNQLGSWLLADALKVTGNVDVRAGSLESNDQNITTGGMISTGNSVRSISFASSSVTFNERSPSEPANITFNGSNLNFIVGTSVIQFNGTTGEINLDGDIPFQFWNVIFFTDEAILQNNTSNPIVFETLSFLGNATIYGDHVIDIWTLTNGYTYFLENGSRQTIQQLNTGDPCDGFISIVAFLESETPAILEFAVDPPLGMSGFYLRSITVETFSGFEWVILQSMPGGNNTGVFFQTPAARDLYWVGGDGDWNDRDNWSLTSGGMGGA